MKAADTGSIQEDRFYQLNCFRLKEVEQKDRLLMVRKKGEKIKNYSFQDESKIRNQSIWHAKSSCSIPKGLHDIFDKSFAKAILTPKITQSGANRQTIPNELPSQNISVLYVVEHSYAITRSVNTWKGNDKDSRSWSFWRMHAAAWWDDHFVSQSDQGHHSLIEGCLCQGDTE